MFIQYQIIIGQQSILYFHSKHFVLLCQQRDLIKQNREMIESTFLLLIALIYVASSFAFIRGTIKSAPFMKPSLARSTTYKERQNDVSTSVDISPHSGAVDVSTFDSEVPRLYGDSGELINWVERYGGTFNADIALDKEGWSLSAPSNVPTNTALVRIPKKLCIYAEPTLMGTPLLDSTSSLMNSLHSSQWRARLAIAVLSERVRPESFFGPYIRNLPFEFWGMPLFYTASELR